MSVTVIPATDYSGSAAGWEMLARGVARGQEIKRSREAAYQDLVMKLSDPNVTEDQQNAILTQDPMQFKASYGVDISQVGKDIAQFRSAAKDVETANGMVMNATAPTGTSKRVLVPHPGGTAQQQQQAATLAATQANTQAELARTKQGEADAALKTKEMAIRTGESTMNVKKTMRTLDGRVPTFNEVQGYLDGNVELTPLKPEADDRERLAYIMGLDPADPVNRVAIHALDNEVRKSDLSVDTMVENKRNIAAEAALKEQEFNMIKAGINPKTGRAFDAGNMIKPNELASLTKGWNDVTEHAMRGLGYPSQMTTDRPWVNLKIPIGGPLSIPFTVAAFTKQTADNPKIGAMLFGNGRADPASVRADLLSSVPTGTRVKTIDFPTIDQRTGQMTTTALTVDQAIPRVVQMRQAWTTEMPALFAAMRQASPATLIYMAAGNPMILQAAKAYAPDVYKMISDARAMDPGGGATSNAPPDADPARTDPATAPMVNDVRRLQKQADELHQMLKGATVTPGER